MNLPQAIRETRSSESLINSRLFLYLARASEIAETCIYIPNVTRFCVVFQNTNCAHFLREKPCTFSPYASQKNIFHCPLYLRSQIECLESQKPQRFFVREVHYCQIFNEFPWSVNGSSSCEICEGSLLTRIPEVFGLQQQEAKCVCRCYNKLTCKQIIAIAFSFVKFLRDRDLEMDFPLKRFLFGFPILYRILHLTLYCFYICCVKINICNDYVCGDYLITI